jgi:hypothetical protein
MRCHGRELTFASLPIADSERLVGCSEHDIAISSPRLKHRACPPIECPIAATLLKSN